MSPEARDTATQWGMTVIDRLGFPIVVCCLLLYAGSYVMQQDRDQIKEDRQFIRTTLNDRLQESTAVIERNNERMEKGTVVLERLESKLSEQ